MNYKVSIVVPVYNNEKYVERCIESLIKQTYKNIEILLINDGSTDNSLEIINKYKRIENVKIFSQKNSGANKARKNGIDNCTGNFVMFVDSDDWIDEDSIEKLINYIKLYNCDIVRFNGILEPSKKIKNKYDFVNSNFLKLSNEEKYNLFITSNLLNSLCFCIYRRELLNNVEAFESSYSNAEDLWANLDIYTKSDNIFLINENFYHYWINENSTTKNKKSNIIQKNTKELLFVLNELNNYLVKWNCNDICHKKKVALKTMDAVRMTACSIYDCNDISKKEKDSFIKSIFDSSFFDNIRINYSYNNLKDGFSSEINIKNTFKLLGIKYIYKRKYKKIYILYKIRNLFGR